VDASLAGIFAGACLFLYNPALQVCLHVACRSHLRAALPWPCLPFPPLPGIYSDSFPGYPQNIYKSSRYHDKLMLAAGWLYRATGAEAARRQLSVAWAGHVRPPSVATQYKLVGEGSPSYCMPAFAPRSPLPPSAGNTGYLTAAHKHYTDAGGRWQVSPYVSWDAAFPPAIVLLLG
jgi:hypothetical protein